MKKGALKSVTFQCREGQVRVPGTLTVERVWATPSSLATTLAKFEFQGLSQYRQYRFI